MSTRDHGGPAFPGQWDHGQGQIESWVGMELRDHFAGLAMPIAATFYDTSDEVCAEAAKWCYAMADAMLAERAKP